MQLKKCKRCFYNSVKDVCISYRIAANVPAMKRTGNRSVNFDLLIRKAKTCFELLNLAEKGQNKSFGRAKDYVWLQIPPVCFIAIVSCCTY